MREKKDYINEYIFQAVVVGLVTQLAFAVGDALIPLDVIFSAWITDGGDFIVTDTGDRIVFNDFPS